MGKGTKRILTKLMVSMFMLFTTETRCGTLLGMQTGEVRSTQITVSSAAKRYTGDMSRLNDPMGWCPLLADTRPYILVHLFKENTYYVLH